jgi:hypothetical protein
MRPGSAHIGPANSNSWKKEFLMTYRRALFLGAIASCSLLAAGVSAKADYAYSTVTTPATTVLGIDGNTSTIGLGPISGSGLTGLQNVALVGVADVVAGSGATGSVPFTTTVTITDPTGSGTITWGGTITFTRSDSSGETSTFTLSTAPNSLTLDGSTYTIGNLVYAQPTVNAQSEGAGRISGLVTVTAAPEPASIAMLGLGLVGVGGVSLRRRLRSI